MVRHSALFVVPVPLRWRVDLPFPLSPLTWCGVSPLFFRSVSPTPPPSVSDRCWYSTTTRYAFGGRRLPVTPHAPYPQARFSTCLVPSVWSGPTTVSLPCGPLVSLATTTSPRPLLPGVSVTRLAHSSGVQTWWTVLLFRHGPVRLLSVESEFRLAFPLHLFTRGRL